MGTDLNGQPINGTTTLSRQYADTHTGDLTNDGQLTIGSANQIILTSNTGYTGPRVQFSGGGYQIQQYVCTSYAAGVAEIHEWWIPWAHEFYMLGGASPSYNVGGFIYPFTGTPSDSNCSRHIYAYAKGFVVQLTTSGAGTFFSWGSVKGYVA